MPTDSIPIGAVHRWNLSRRGVAVPDLRLYAML